MISISERKLIRSLKQKKFRDQEGLFVVEGTKMVQEALNSNFQVRALYAQIEDLFLTSIPAKLVTEQQMSEITHFTTPSPALALVGIGADNLLNPWEKIDKSSLYLGLDSIRDPGNLGTIIRIADWFGIKAIFATPDSVDLYNPKVIQASMGSIFRVPLYYVDILTVIETLNIPVWGTGTEGKSIYEASLTNNGLIIIGNESMGISSSLRKKIANMLSIPSYPNGSNSSESLNVAVATAIICAEFRRRYP